MRNGSKSFREKNGLDTEGYCDIKMICDWRMDLMAKVIFETLWRDKKAAVMEAYSLLRECYQADSSSNRAAISALQGKIARATAKIENLISMRAEGEISKEEFQSQRKKAEDDLAALKAEMEKLDTSGDDKAASLDMSAIQKALDEVLDFSGPKIDEHIIDKFVCRVTPIENGRFRWDLNFAPGHRQAIIGAVHGRKGHATVEIEENGEDDEHPHRTYDGVMRLVSRGTIAYQPLIAACEAIYYPRKLVFIFFPLKSPEKKIFV